MFDLIKKKGNGNNMQIEYMMTTYNSSKNNDEIIVIRDEYKTSLKKKFLKKIKYSLSLNFSFSFFDIVL